ncbi:23S rRNA (uracil(747)-C(5))-methyltransferase RlmC [Pseudarthrobacter niigatensis]|uniref:23S rRNA (Uracil747-C5)-methyltransferase n=1 Tax=Pseudarthrobacter niigatensis TaxID=369935 RepID=A0AAJ1SYS4_9MICC|nr:23S rRNA (uracil(747)-C(5))-methyltransferase RlmC [Pseudarthrobacter niigatensis]MDQ0146808.1 23S rRNA (uracil747-C5)-methyltransferase [Pseudarthrobacter niigatensis]MDQ0264646.1 23S rRNA (uracil747-C5)-methyltransferase [Pseudarthrobacter niigatensis]
MRCSYFDAGTCRSCTHMGRPYGEQLAGKQLHCQTLLAGHTELEWLEPVASQESGFRNKAKMVIGGTAQNPTIGILDADGHGVDLRKCGVCSPGLRAVFPVLATYIRRLRLTPYDVPKRTGELKHVIITESPTGAVMLRLVLRSEQTLPRIRKHLADLLADLPQVKVVSVNLLPEHKAVLEGDREILLTEQSTLEMRVNDINLHLRPQSFFQTNTGMAAALYRQGREWVNELAPASVWDLYCGVGGFALHSAAPSRTVTGIETSSEAIVSARLSSDEAGLAGMEFQAGDATAFALAAERSPDLVIVNPPRRGIGKELCGWLESSDVQHVVYSSCNAQSLARDLAALPSFTARRARVLDMFPQTTHYEVMVLLERTA